MPVARIRYPAAWAFRPSETLSMISLCDAIGLRLILGWPDGRGWVVSALSQLAFTGSCLSLLTVFLRYSSCLEPTLDISSSFTTYARTSGHSATPTLLPLAPRPDTAGFQSLRSALIEVFAILRCSWVPWIWVYFPWAKIILQGQSGMVTKIISFVDAKWFQLLKSQLISGKGLIRFTYIPQSEIKQIG